MNEEMEINGHQMSKSPNISFPASKAKQIIMTDPDVKDINKKAVDLVRNAAFAFTEQLITKVFEETHKKNRKTANFNDFLAAVRNDEQLHTILGQFVKSKEKTEEESENEEETKHEEDQESEHHTEEEENKESDQQIHEEEEDKDKHEEEVDEDNTEEEEQENQHDVPEAAKSDDEDSSLEGEEVQIEESTDINSDIDDLE